MNDTAASPMVAKPVAPHTSPAPSITVMAAGGCGINMMRYIKDAEHHLSTVRRFDTSYSNSLNGEDIVQVANGDGSGKVRGEHSEVIQKNLTKLTDDELGLSDINIVVFSLGGGSGSVIGPVLIREVARRGGQAVAFVVGDTMSERDAENTLRTLQTLQAICSNNNIYLPTTVFSNAAVGRPVVDVSLPHRLQQFIYVMALPAREIDRNDRRNFLNGMKTVQAQPGVRLLHVIGGTSGDDDTETGETWKYDEDSVLDSSISLGIQPSKPGQLPVFVSHQAIARVAYQGVLADHIVTPLYAMISSGNDGIVSLTKALDAVLARFKAQTRNVTSAIDMTGAKVGDGDLVI